MRTGFFQYMIETPNPPPRTLREFLSDLWQKLRQEVYDFGQIRVIEKSVRENPNMREFIEKL